MALRRAVAIYQQAETVMLESPVLDSMADGAAGRAARSSAGQVRTIRHHVERRINVSIPKDSAMMSWLVSWAEDVNLRYKVHATGRKSHEWVTGHRCEQPVAGFAEKTHFKITTKKNHMHKMNSEWSTGYFLGRSENTAEYVVATTESIFACATIRRLPDDEAYDPECIQLVKITYRDSVLEGARSTPAGDTHNKNADSDPITDPMVSRWVRLQPGDFQNLGYTVGCPGCDQLQSRGSARRNHIESCRNHIDVALNNTDLGKDRLGKAKDRLDAKVAELMEEKVADGPGHPTDVSNEEHQPQGEMPTASSDMDEEALLKELPTGSSDMRTSTRGTSRDIHIGTPDRF